MQKLDTTRWISEIVSANIVCPQMLKPQWSVNPYLFKVRLPKPFCFEGYTQWNKVLNLKYLNKMSILSTSYADDPTANRITKNLSMTKGVNE